MSQNADSPGEEQHCERCERLEEQVSELYQRVGYLEGVTDQLEKRISD